MADVADGSSAAGPVADGTSAAGPAADGTAAAGPVAVLVCGQVRSATERNAVLRRSPAETWRRLLHHALPVHFFSCTEAPLRVHGAGFDWLKQWTDGAAISQFDRLAKCLGLVEGEVT